MAESAWVRCVVGSQVRNSISSGEHRRLLDRIGDCLKLADLLWAELCLFHERVFLIVKVVPLISHEGLRKSFLVGVNLNLSSLLLRDLRRLNCRQLEIRVDPRFRAPSSNRAWFSAQLLGGFSVPPVRLQSTYVSFKKITRALCAFESELNGRRRGSIDRLLRQLQPFRAPDSLLPWLGVQVPKIVDRMSEEV